MSRIILIDPVFIDPVGTAQSVQDYIAFKNGERDSYWSPHNEMTIYGDLTKTSETDPRRIETENNMNKLLERTDRENGLRQHSTRDLIDLLRSIGQFRTESDTLATEADCRWVCNEMASNTELAEAYRATHTSSRGSGSTLSQRFANTRLGRMSSRSLRQSSRSSASSNTENLGSEAQSTDQAP